MKCAGLKIMKKGEPSKARYEVCVAEAACNVIVNLKSFEGISVEDNVLVDCNYVSKGIYVYWGLIRFLIAYSIFGFLLYITCKHCLPSK